MYESIEIWCEHKRKLTKTNYASQSRHFKILSDVIDWKFGKLLHLLYSKYCIPMESVTKTVLFWQQIFYFVRIIIRQHHVSSAWKKDENESDEKVSLYLYERETYFSRWYLLSLSHCSHCLSHQFGYIDYQCNQMIWKELNKLK